MRPAGMAGAPPSNGHCTSRSMSSDSVSAVCEPCSVTPDFGRCSKEAAVEPGWHAARVRRTLEGGACLCSLIPDGTTCPVCVKVSFAQQHEHRPPLPAPPRRWMRVATG